MKKFLIILVAISALAILSCNSSPAPATNPAPPAATPAPAPAPAAQPKPATQGDSTQVKANEAPAVTYVNKLDMTGAVDYVVVKGDTLSDIARKQYGGLTNVGVAGARNGFYFPVIILASPNTIADPDLIEVGMKLKIVDLKINLDNPVSRQAIKDCLLNVSSVYNKKGVKATEDGLIRLANSL